MKFVIVTGLSGAGKSQTVKCMEDLGYYCIDNLPPTLIPNFIDLCLHTESEIHKVALVIDIRGGDFFDDTIFNLKNLETEGFKYNILFLEASDEVLIKRFKETRRVHPLSKDGDISQGIAEERKRLKKIKLIADNIIDTSYMTAAQLKSEITKIYKEGKRSEDITIIIESFGFKKGIPLDADMVFDVRFIPNPYYLKSMKNLTGNNKKVIDYIKKWPETVEFMNKVYDLMSYLIPYYIREGKSQIVVAFGCTGGQHRSVAISNMLHEKLEKEGKRLTLIHRELEKR